MKVSELIERLMVMPQDAECKYVWDGGARGSFGFVYLSNGCDVICVDHGDYVSSNENCPLDKCVDSDKMFWFNDEHGYN